MGQQRLYLPIWSSASGPIPGWLIGTGTVAAASVPLDENGGSGQIRTDGTLRGVWTPKGPARGKLAAISHSATLPYGAPAQTGAGAPIHLPSLRRCFSTTKTAVSTSLGNLSLSNISRTCSESLRA